MLKCRLTVYVSWGSLAQECLHFVMTCCFQGKLSGLSDEIQHLQDCSVDLSIRLQNRRRAEVLLDQFLTRTLVRAFSEGAESK